MRDQAKKFGCDIRANQKIKTVELKSDLKRITTESGDNFTAKTVIIASGGNPRTLGIESENKFQGKGISYCATCDGDFFTDKEIAVIGGGNSALEEAVSLSKYASKITILHEFDHFQAFQSAIDAAEKNEKLNFIFETEIIDFEGDQQIEKVIYKEKRTDKICELKISGVFIFIGYVPASEMFKDQIEINTREEIVADEDMKTSLPGVFVAGDVRAKKYRQVTTAVSDGTIAALSVIEFLENN